jgi:hypothetical protein
MKNKTKVKVEVDWDEEEPEVIVNKKITKCVSRFFDFYVLSLLNYFAGPNSLNHHNKARRIEETYEMIVDEMYGEIRRALEYSVLREFRHFSDQAELNDDADTLEINNYKLMKETSRRCYGWFENDQLSNHLEGKPNKLELNDSLFRTIYSGYMDYSWDDAYGGKLWGEATSFLWQHPKTTKDKELWVDRVLDLHHNNGHLLNKTKFNCLSNSGDSSEYEYEFEFTNDGNKKKRKRVVRHCALDYRREALTITDLSMYASTKVRNLSTANLNFLPEAVR